MAVGGDMTACEYCGDGGTVLVAVGPVDPFGVPDGTVEAPCPHCEAGDREAEHRIGRSWRTPAHLQEREAA